MSKFYYIRESDMNGLHELFRKKDPELKMVLNQYGEWVDIATYAPKYKTVVFTTVKRTAVNHQV